MDSTLALDTGTLTDAAAPAGRLRALLARFRDGTRESGHRRLRRLTLDAWRVGAVGIVAGLLAAALSVADVWRTRHNNTRDAAASAMAFVDARLDDIDRELSRLDDDALRQPMGALSTGGEPCSAALTSSLVRASLASTLVQRFMIGHEGGDFACHPDGSGPAFGAQQRPARVLALSSTGEIAVRLMVARAGRGGRVLAAELDPRAFAVRGANASPWGTEAVMHIVLLTADGRRLATLDESEPSTLAAPAFRAVAQSQRHLVMTAAHLDAAPVFDAAWARAIAATAAVWLALLVGVGLAWQRTLRRARLSHRIEGGLRKRQFEPFVQPIVDLASGRCAGAEVLMRWAHPQRGTLAPSEFIEEAERTGLIVGMSELVMARAAHRLAPIAAAHPDLYFSFNVTPAQLRLPRFAQQLAQLFHAGTLPREQVLLELTEREFVDPNGTRVLASLRADGWRIAIDDFGTGHSSLATLEQLPIDRIKVDRAFVKAIGEQTVSRPVLDSIIALADRLKVKLIAEGVETQAQWDYLAARGVQCAQGYLIARPMAIDAFAQWLAAQQGSASAPGAAAARTAADQCPVVPAQAQQLWQHMRMPGGLDIRDRIYRLHSYPRCFIGREAVDWLVRHERVNRAQAVQLGRRLAALGLIGHVHDEHDFEDAELFYRLSSPAPSDSSAAPAAGDLRAQICGPLGVPLRDHSRGLLRHRQCATGREIVDWMVHTYSVPRPTAAQWAAQLMRQGALRHVFDDQPFRDERSLYRPG